MEEKYCERCGLYLGIVRSTKRYCTECKRKVDKERDKERRKAGTSFKQRNTFCAFCGKPLVQTSIAQKYHKECAYPARLKIMREYNKAYIKKPAPVNKQKDKTTKKILSVEQVQRLADKAGISYAMASLKLATGELAYER